jgi:hypothetical protein
VKKCLEIKQQSKLLRRESTYLPKILKKTAPKNIYLIFPDFSWHMRDLVSG